MIVAKKIINYNNQNYIIIKYDDNTYAIMLEYEFRKQYPKEKFTDASSDSIDDRQQEQLFNQINQSKPQRLSFKQIVWAILVIILIIYGIKFSFFS